MSGIHEPDPAGHLWDLDWIDLENGFRCLLCFTPGYRASDAQRCGKADLLPVVRARQGVAS